MMGKYWVPRGETKSWSGLSQALKLPHKVAFQGTQLQHTHLFPRTIYKPTACKLNSEWIKDTMQEMKPPGSQGAEGVRLCGLVSDDGFLDTPPKCRRNR